MDSGSITNKLHGPTSQSMPDNGVGVEVPQMAPLPKLVAKKDKKWLIIGDGRSVYEWERDKDILQNKRMLRELGLDKAPQELFESVQ